MKKPKDLIILEKKLGVTLQEGAMATILNWYSRNTYALDQKGQLIGLNLKAIASPILLLYPNSQGYNP